MKNIIKFEFLKLFTSKLFLYTLLAFTLLNIAIVIYTGSLLKQNEIPYSAYQLLNEKLQNLTNEEKKEYIEKEYEKNYAFSIISNSKNLKNSENEAMRQYSEVLKEENKEIYVKYISEYENAEYPYTKDALKEFTFWEEIKQEFEESQNYKETINGILQKANNLETISIFKESQDDFSSKNIKDTAKEYEKMLDTEINYQPSKGINSFTQMGITDILIILLLFIISSIIVFEEREKNLLTLIKSTKNGRTKTILSKIIVLCVSIVGISFVLYFTNFVYYAITIGYGDLGASLQSIKTFTYSTLQVNVGQYLLLFLFTKMIVFFVISLITVFISIIAKNNVTIYIIFIGIFLVSFVLYYTIEPSSPYHIFKYVNIGNFLETNGIYNTYFNLKIGIIMQNLLTFSIVFGIILLIGVSFGVLYIFNKKKDLQIRESYLANKIKGFILFKPKIATKVFSTEFYKLFVTNKIAIILILFFFFQIYTFQHANKTISFGETVYKNYMEILNGKLTQEKVKFIEEEKSKFYQAEISIQNIEERVNKKEISKNEANRYKEPYEEILSTQNIFDRVLEQYQYIKENPKYEFVYDTGYKELLRVNRNSFLESDVFLIIMCIACFTSIFVLEYKTGMINILNTTPKGRKYTAKSKIKVCAIAGGILFLMSVIPEILKIGQMYEFSNITAPISSLLYFKNLPSQISILGFIGIMYLLRLITYMSIILWILWISVKLKNSIYSVLVGSTILLLPIIVIVLGLEMASWFSVIPVLNISKIILAGGNLCWAYIIIPILIGGYSYWKLCKNFE